MRATPPPAARSGPSSMLVWKPTNAFSASSPPPEANGSVRAREAAALPAPSSGGDAGAGRLTFRKVAELARAVLVAVADLAGGAGAAADAAVDVDLEAVLDAVGAGGGAAVAGVAVAGRAIAVAAAAIAGHAAGAGGAAVDVGL